MAAYIVETYTPEDETMFKSAFPEAVELIRCRDCKYGIESRRAGEDRVQCCISDFDMVYPSKEHYCGYARNR